MMQSRQTKVFNYGKYSYSYDLIELERKSLTLSVLPSKQIVVKAPRGTDEESIQKFLAGKWLWLQKQLDVFERYHKKRYRREYVSGESSYYLGRQYKILVKSSGKNCVILQNGVICIGTAHEVRNGEYNRLLLKDWYQQQRRKVFRERFLLMTQRFDYEEVPMLLIRPMAKRWGSYLPSNKVVLNPKLIEASIDAIDYVIVHELCHVKYRSHDDKFFSFLNSKFPNWKLTKDKLEVKHG